MPLRTELFQQLPWDGGLNTRLDPALIPPNQLQVADNVVFATKGSRKTREGIGYFDAIAFANTQASSGTTRTLVMDRSLTGLLSPGDKISVFHDSFDENYDGQMFVIDSITTTTLTDDTLTYTASTSFTETTTAAPVLKVGKTVDGLSVRGLIDFFRNEGGGSKVRDLIGVFSDGTVAEYNDSGIRSIIANSGTSISDIDAVAFEQINEKLIIGLTGTANTPKKITSTGGNLVLDDLGGDPPNFSVCREHLARVWTNDKSDPDRLHYSATGNPEEWNGSGDSGAIDIGPGDGDPSGITAIFPAFKGELFVAKKRRLYRVSGFTPETFAVRLVSDGIGCESHQSVVPVDQDDILYISERGFHRLSATAQFGDFSAQFISSDIQPTTQNFINLSQSSGVYIPDLNSVAWAVNEQTTSGNSGLYLYNILFQQWYRWTGISSDALATRLAGGRDALAVGTNNGRILELKSGQFSDFGNQGIPVRIKTGIVYPDNNPYTVKGFKKVVVMFIPQGETSFNVEIQIDNLEPQTVTFSQEGVFDGLGSAFVLGQSTLGVNPVLSPVTLPIDGFGHGATFEIEKNTADEPIEVFSFGYEYEPASTGQEVVLGGGGGDSE